jgi:hypothetical protein
MTSDDTGASEATAAFDNLDAAAKRAGRSIAAALTAGQAEGRRFESVLRQLEQQLAAMAIESAVRGLGGLASQAIGGGLSSVLTAAESPVAETFATSASGLIGDAKPAYAAARAPQAMTVTMNVTTPDAESFRRSEGQISAQLARMAQRGQRGL